jgi:hypothetical protein
MIPAPPPGVKAQETRPPGAAATLAVAIAAERALETARAVTVAAV